MGNFYTNATIRSIKRNKIINLLKRYKRECYISPEVDGFTTVYDFECEDQDTRVLKRLATMISENLICDVITFLNHDEDILSFKIYDSGTLVADYEAKPDYFESDLELDLTIEKNAQMVAQTFGVNQNCFQSVVEVLKQPLEYYMAIERHEKLLKALGMPNLSVGFGYTYLNEGDLPEPYSINDFEHIKGDRRFYPE